MFEQDIIAMLMVDMALSIGNLLATPPDVKLTGRRQLDDLAPCQRLSSRRSDATPGAVAAYLGIRGG